MIGRINAYIECAIWVQSTWEVHISKHVCEALCLDDTFNASVDVLPIYIGVGLQMLSSFTNSRSSLPIEILFPPCF